MRFVSQDGRQVVGEVRTDETFMTVLGEAVAAVESVGIPYVLMGGVASAAIGRLRWTHDIDLLVRPDDARPALSALAAAGFDVEETDAHWLYKGFKHDVLVDVIFRSAGDIFLDDEMLARCSLVDHGGQSIRIIAPEDLVVIKAVVSAEHVPQRWYDALGVLASCEMDWEYLAARARRFGLRRVLSLLLFAQSNDLPVPDKPIRMLYETLHVD
ncbi:MAG: nucleotidyltransferase family protein [Actinobacteria bacterium]|nr:MAG: nucleotidyltransferase family protein [Actinomycetota bacterium]